MSGAVESGAAPVVALTIAGSDSSGGAGIQADIKTFTVHGVYGASVITALTAQNTQGVRGVEVVPGAFVALQIAAVLDDLDVKAAKTGMLANVEVISAVVEQLEGRFQGDLVVDPVMIATSGDRLIDPDAVDVLRGKLFPLAKLITPNLAEAASLCGVDQARSIDDMEAQGRQLLEAGPEAVLIKGGHGDGEEAVDLLVTRHGCRQFSAPRISSDHTHGSGCTLSAAITANLARGIALDEAVSDAKKFVTNAIIGAASRPVGRGRAPLDHLGGMGR